MRGVTMNFIAWRFKGDPIDGVAFIAFFWLLHLRLHYVKRAGYFLALKHVRDLYVANVEEGRGHLVLDMPKMREEYEP